MDKLIFVTLILPLIHGAPVGPSSNVNTSTFGANTATFGAVIVAIASLSIFLAIILCFGYEIRKKEPKKRGNRPNSQYDNPAFLNDSDIQRRSTKVDISELKRTENDKYLLQRSGSASKAWASLPKSTTNDLSNLMGSTGSLDQNLAVPESNVVTVPLESHDFIGLGFNIAGNMRDGIYVREVNNHGPAKESGMIQQGDRVVALTVSFKNMVYDDAAAILSYSSPYPVILTTERGQKLIKPLANLGKGSTEFLCHPICRSKSLDDLTDLGKRPKARLKSTNVTVQVEKHDSPKSSTNLGKFSKASLADISLSSSNSSEVYSSKELAAEAVIEKVNHDSDSVKSIPVNVHSDPFVDLNDEDKLEIMKLSYEDNEVPQNVVNSFAGIITSQEKSKVADQINETTLSVLHPGLDVHDIGLESAESHTEEDSRVDVKSDVEINSKVNFGSMDVVDHSDDSDHSDISEDHSEDNPVIDILSDDFLKKHLAKPSSPKESIKSFSSDSISADEVAISSPASVMFNETNIVPEENKLEKPKLNLDLIDSDSIPPPPPRKVVGKEKEEVLNLLTTSMTDISKIKTIEDQRDPEVCEIDEIKISPIIHEKDQSQINFDFEKKSNEETNTSGKALSPSLLDLEIVPDTIEKTQSELHLPFRDNFGNVPEPPPRKFVPVELEEYGSKPNSLHTAENQSNIGFLAKDANNYGFVSNIDDIIGLSADNDNNFQSRSERSISPFIRVKDRSENSFEAIKNNNRFSLSSTGETPASPTDSYDSDIVPEIHCQEIPIWKIPLKLDVDSIPPPPLRKAIGQERVDLLSNLEKIMSRTERISPHRLSLEDEDSEIISITEGKISPVAHKKDIKNHMDILNDFENGIFNVSDKTRTVLNGDLLMGNQNNDENENFVSIK